MAAKQNFDEFFDQRRHRRVAMTGEARVNFGGRWHGCRIIDLSGGGGRFRSSIKPIEGANVLVQLRGLGIVRGKVVHRESACFSVEFNQEDYEPDALVDTLMLSANAELMSRKDELAAGAAVLDISEGDAETADDEDETGHKKKKRAGGKLRRLFGT